MEIINLNFIYKPSQYLDVEAIKSFQVPSTLPLLAHVYTIDDNLISALPSLVESEPSLQVILFGFTAKHVSNTIGPVKEGGFEGFSCLKPAELNKVLQA